jgi:hypothetical protein
MNDNSEYLNRLFKSASTETPGASAKARAIAAMAEVTGGASGSHVTGTGMKALFGGALATVLCGAAGVALFSQRGVHREPRVESVTPSVTVQVSSSGNVTGRVEMISPSSPSAPPLANLAASAGADDQCSSISLPDDPPAVCSTDGDPLLLTVVNTCSTEPVDLYWVTFFCEERFYKQIAPGQSVHQSTFDTHPWRVRDHATHRLIKEITPTRAGTKPWGPVVQAEELNRHVVVTPEDHAEETQPRCSEGGGNPEAIEFVNARADEVADLYFVDSQCGEIFFTGLRPGEDLRRPSLSSHAWRLRDHATHRLLKDIPPSVPSTGARVTEPSAQAVVTDRAPARDATYKWEFVVTDRDQAVESESQCSEAGRPVELTVVNDRVDAVELYWLNYDCEEVRKARVEPGQRWTHPSEDASRWRVRDEKTHALVKEFSPNPNPGAERLYVAVP